MKSKNFHKSVLLLSLTFFTLFGCGGDEREPPPDTITDQMLQENLLGAWQVTSINDKPPAAYLVGVVTADNASIPGTEETPIPAAPIGNKRGEFVDIREDETHASVKINDAHFSYNFEADNTGSLSIVFEMLPNDQDELFGEEAQDSTAGEGMADPPPDPNKDNTPIQDPEPLPPAQDSEILFKKIEVAGTWTGTYSISDGLLSFLVTAEDVKLTADLQAHSPKLSDTEKEAYRNELMEKFREHLLKPWQDTFATIEDETLTLKVPGGSLKIVLHRQ